MTLSFAIVASIAAPIITLMVLKNHLLPDIKAILTPVGKLEVLTYVHQPILFMALYFLQGTLSLHSLLLNYTLLFFAWLIAFNDYRHKKIPNSYVLAFLAVWVLITVPQLFANIEYALPLLRNSVLGAAIGGGLFLLVYIISRKGIGGGDVKYMTVAGLYLGLNGVLPATLYASILTTIIGGILILTKRLGRKDSMPFAPFLYVSFIIVLFLM